MKNLARPNANTSCAGLTKKFHKPRFADFSLRKTRGFFTYALAPFLTTITSYFLRLSEQIDKFMLIQRIYLTLVNSMYHLFSAQEKMSVFMLFEICFYLFDILYITS